MAKISASPVQYRGDFNTAYPSHPRWWRSGGDSRAAPSAQLQLVPGSLVMFHISGALAQTTTFQTTCSLQRFQRHLNHRRAGNDSLPTSSPLTTSPPDGARAGRVALRGAPTAACNAPLPPKEARSRKPVCPESLPLGPCCCCRCCERGIRASLNWEVSPRCAERHAGGRPGPTPSCALSASDLPPHVTAAAAPPRAQRGNHRPTFYRPHTFPQVNSRCWLLGHSGGSTYYSCHIGFSTESTPRQSPV